MNFMESLRVALASLWANKMRSFLTMLGIIIGISSVITVMALGKGSQDQIGGEFEKIGANRVFFYMNWDNTPKYRDRFDDGDIETIKRVFKDDIRAVSQRQTTNAKVTKGKEEAKIDVYGVNQDYNKIESIEILKGRYLLESDVKGQRSVAVVNKDFAMKLFKRTDVLGEKILIDNGWSKASFTIIGIYEGQQTAFQQPGAELTTSVYIPYTSAKKLGFGDKYYMFEANLEPGKNNEKTIKDIMKVIERRHKNEGKEFYSYQALKDQLEMANKVMGILSGVVTAIAAISLFVGGIGVMNIMLVSVTERTREIGIRKAIGARRRDILIQFLVEAMIIAGIGGIIGTILGQGLASLIAISIKVPPSISISSILIAVSFSAVVGIFFGMYPANKAAKLDPIEALRYE